MAHTTGHTLHRAAFQPTPSHTGGKEAAVLVPVAQGSETPIAPTEHTFIGKGYRVVPCGSHLTHTLEGEAERRRGGRAASGLGGV